jgi:hypothetical protein
VSSLVQQTLSALSIPRLTGSPGWGDTTAFVRSTFTDLGYRVTEHEFEFSDWPGRFGPLLVGFLISLGAGSAWALARTNHLTAALAVLLAVQVTTALLITASERFLLRFPRGRRKGVNLMASAGTGRPRWILVAHRDSKSQFVPIALRIAAVAVAGVVWILMFAGTVLAMVGVNTTLMTWPVAAAGVAAGLVLMACLTGNDSAGALDNASGVATLVGIAAREQGAQDIAFLITDAEEFGLAGASAIAGSLAWLEGLINFDGVDDHGPLRVLGRFGTPRRGGAPLIEDAFRAASAEAGENLRGGAVPRGLLLDHLAFARVGIPAVTVMRGTWRSMARVHRPADTPARLRGEGIVATVEVVRRALAKLRALAPDRPGY